MQIDNKDSSCRVHKMVGIKFVNEETNLPRQGDYFKGNMILRFKDGLLHAENEPAVEYHDGHMEYFKDGVLHRPVDEGPAIIDVEGKKKTFEYWENGVFVKREGRLV